MNSHPHSVFQTREDHFAWPKYLEQVDLIQLSDLDKTRAKNAINFFRNLLGEGFLRRGALTGHPLFFELSNSAPMARLRLIRLAECLIKLQESKGFADLIRRVKKPNQFREAMTVQEAASVFWEAGFTIVFEPTFNVEQVSGKETTKRPDFLFTDDKTGEEIVVEVSSLLPSSEQVRANRTFDTIWWLLHRAMNDSLVIEVNRERNEQISHFILPYATVLRHLNEEELTGIIEKVNLLIAKVKKTNEYQELSINGVNSCSKINIVWHRIATNYIAKTVSLVITVLSQLLGTKVSR